jgi:hypothetical protein
MVHKVDLDLHSPKSQSLSLSYGPNLPTSLTHFIPETRGFKPWRPAAVMGTSRGANRIYILGVSRLDISAPITQKNECLSNLQTPSPNKPFQGIANLLRRKENSFRGKCRVNRGHLRCRSIVHVLVQEY